MSQTSTEFIFFTVKPDVKPEDPDGSGEGEALLKVFRATQQQSGHHSSAWGRTEENPNMIVWVIVWTDARCSINSELLKPFLVKADELLTTVYATLSPPISSSNTLTDNPVTELCFLPFCNDMSPAETRQLHADLINFRSALVVQLPQAAGPLSWAMGHLDRPSTVRHEKSPTGHATVHLLAVGWESVESHERAKETKEFKSGITPIREKVLPPIPGLEMKHVRFQKI